MTDTSCTHAKVRVDYDHPFGLVPDVPLAELQASAPALTRPFMTLDRPRCIDCGVMLTQRMLDARTRPGGDLYDPRFLWPWMRSTLI
jgi:hypothetical protein